MEADEEICCECGLTLRYYLLDIDGKKVCVRCAMTIKKEKEKKKMTQSAFDPACFSTYPASNPPKFLHFEYEGSSDIHRYMLVDRFHVNDISPVTKRCQGEADDDGLRDKYINRPVRTVEKEVEKLVTTCPDCGALMECALCGHAEGPEVSMEPAGENDAVTEPSEGAGSPTEPEPNAEASVEQPEAQTDS